MEQAAVGNPRQKYYCHECSVVLSYLLPNHKCPHCLGGFIEIISSEDNPPSSGIPVQVAPSNMPAMNWANEQNPFSITDFNRRYPFHSSRRRRFSNSRRPRYNSRSRAITRMPMAPRFQMPFENMMQNYILNLNLGNQYAFAGNMQFLGNPGDYAWGDSLDTVVTQLLNQMEDNGPPPLPIEQIEQIEKCAIEQHQVDANVQCSVCWDDFSVGEIVRKLPCMHVFHEDCIFPWMKLHRTCPVCRDVITIGCPESQEQKDESEQSCQQQQQPQSQPQQQEQQQQWQQQQWQQQQWQQQQQQQQQQQDQQFQGQTQEPPQQQQQRQYLDPRARYLAALFDHISISARNRMNLSNFPPGQGIVDVTSPSTSTARTSLVTNTETLEDSTPSSNSTSSSSTSSAFLPRESTVSSGTDSGSTTNSSSYVMSSSSSTNVSSSELENQTNDTTNSN